MYARPRRLPWPAIAAMGLVLLLILVILVSLPRVTGVSPGPDQRGVPASAAISINFSRAMDEDSVESRISIEPSHAGKFLWQGNTLVFQPDTAWPEGLTVSVRLAAGATSRGLLPMLQGYSWSFVIGGTRVIYLWPSDGPADIFARTLDGQQTDRLTEVALGVHDFGLALDGTSIVYSAMRPDDGTDLHRLDLVTGEDLVTYACPSGYRCQSPSVSPDGDVVAFERLTEELGPGGQAVAGPSQVWLVGLAEGKEATPVSPAGHHCSVPSWSSQGYLSYYDDTLREIVILQFDAQGKVAPVHTLATELGTMHSWSPDGISLVYPVLVFPSEEGSATPQAAGAEGIEAEGNAAFYSHLFRFNLATGEVEDLSGEPGFLVEDASPAYSPDGQWIAFARKFLDEERWTLGRQLWLMKADGLLLTQLTSNPSVNHSSITWSSDSRFLVYMRFNQADFTQPAEIWLADVEKLSFDRLVEGGYLPQWLP